MINEKSCGAIVYRHHRNRILILLIKHIKGGHWAFPKGHIEDNETEEETALREVKEETGIDVIIEPNFKESICYNPKKDIKKEVVYFLANAKHNNVKMQQEEISDVKWVEIDKCFELLTYDNDISLLNKAKKYFI